MAHQPLSSQLKKLTVTQDRSKTVDTNCQCQRQNRKQLNFATIEEYHPLCDNINSLIKWELLQLPPISRQAISDTKQDGSS